MAAAMTRAFGRSRSPLTLFLSKRSFFVGSHYPAASPLAGLLSLRPAPVPSPGSARFNWIRCRLQRYCDSASSSPDSDLDLDLDLDSDLDLDLDPATATSPSTEMEPPFPGLDYQHWLVVMDEPGGEDATKEQLIECYIQTLANFVGSEEEAKKKIYSVSFERYFGFGCEIDEETSNKIEGLPGVIFVIPDSYVDIENKDYGAELFVDGEVVQRSPERQRRIDPVAKGRPRDYF